MAELSLSGVYPLLHVHSLKKEAWEDVHPAWRYARMCNWIQDNRIAVPNPWELDLFIDKICKKFGWSSPIQSLEMTLIGLDCRDDKKTVRIDSDAPLNAGTMIEQLSILKPDAEISAERMLSIVGLDSIDWDKAFRLPPGLTLKFDLGKIIDFSRMILAHLKTYHKRLSQFVPGDAIYRRSRELFNGPESSPGKVEVFPASCDVGLQLMITDKPLCPSCLSYEHLQECSIRNRFAKLVGE
jgi:hypothetical protein